MAGERILIKIRKKNGRHFSFPAAVEKQILFCILKLFLQLLLLTRSSLSCLHFGDLALLRNCDQLTSIMSPVLTDCPGHEI